MKKIYLLALLAVLGFSAIAQTTPPIVSGLSVTVGIPGSSLTISGTGFNTTASNNVVYFGATRATVTSASTTSLTVTIPFGATHSFVSVTNSSSGLTGSSPNMFIPTFNNAGFVADSVRFDAPDNLMVGGNLLVATGDLDGDGKTDLVAFQPGGESGSVVVFRNISTSGSLSSASFEEGVTFTLGVQYVFSAPAKLDIRDMDGDGKPDIIAIGSYATDGNTTSILRNTVTSAGSFSSSSFAASIEIPSGSAVGAIIEDLNMDGRPDILVSNEVGDFVIHENTSSAGSLSFATPVELTEGLPVLGSAFMFTADINGDGKHDLILAGSSYSSGIDINILKNQTSSGSFAFSSPTVLHTSSNISSLAVGDLNADSKADIVALNSDLKLVSIYQNTTAGSISFSSSVDFSFWENEPKALELGDYNGDGKLDIAFIKDYGSKLSVLRNIITSGAITSSSFAEGDDMSTASIEMGSLYLPDYMFSADLDGDGIGDLVVTGTSGFAITRNHPVPLGISGSPEVCVGAETTLYAPTSGGTWSSGDTAVATVNATTGVVTGMTPGYALISYTITGITSIKLVTVNALPAVAPISGLSTVCVGASITVTDSATSGSWTVSNPSILTFAGIDPPGGKTINGVSAGTATVTYAVTTGACTSYETKTITVFSGTVSAITGTAVVCLGSTTSLSTVTTGGVWSSSNSLIAVVSASGVVSGAGAGTVKISYTVSGGSGCTGFATKTVTVIAMPTAGTITGAESVCSGATITLTKSVTGGVWSSSAAGVAMVGTGGVVSGVAAGTATVSYTVTNACGAATATKIVTVNASPSVADAATLTMAVGSTVSLSGTPAGGTWSSGSVSVATVGTGSGIVTGLTAGTTNITYSFSTGCVAIRQVTVTFTSSPTYTISNFAGNGTAGYGGDGGAATAAMVNGTNQMAMDASGNIYIADYYNNRVRKVSPAGVITTVAGNGVGGYDGDGGQATASRIAHPQGIAVDAAGNIYIAEVYNQRIRKVNTSGIISTIAGTGDGGYSGNGGPATAAMIRDPTALHVDASGNIYFCDNGNWRVRKINTSGVISLVAGNGLLGSTGDGGPATAARMAHVTGLWTDLSGNLYIADPMSYKIRKVNTSGIISTAAGNGTEGSSGDGGAATAAQINFPHGLNVDAEGNIYFAETNGHRIRKVSSTGIISTIAGTGVEGYSGDGGPALVATLRNPNWVFASSSGKIYVSDAVNYRVRILSPTNTIGGSMNVCSGSTTTLTHGVTGGSWSSSNTAVATIGLTNGVVMGVTSGTAAISYVYSGTAATTVITVGTTPSAGTITGAGSVCVGSVMTLSDGVSGGSWTSGSTGIATVSSSGVVSGVSAGTATISYAVANSCGTTFATKMVTVNGVPGAGTIAGSSAVSVAATITLSNIVTGGIWSSGTIGIATVNSMGVVTGVAAGTVVISYTMNNGCSTAVATKVITVNPSVAVTITGDSVVCVGAVISLTAGEGAGAWSSSNTAKATVSATGVVTGVTAGTAVISYNLSGSVATAIVTVNALPAVIAGTPKACPGITTTLSDATAGGSWSSSDPDIAAISSTGMVTGMDAGTVNIIYTLPTTCSRSAIVTINANPADITGSTSVCTGATTTLSSATSGLMWSSSNASKASVNSVTGVVTGVAEGTADITYKNTTTGCLTTTVVEVSAMPANIGGTKKACPGTTTTLTNTTIGGTWSSIDPSMVTVEVGTGVVTGVVAGTTTIIYSITGGCSKSTVVTINATPTISGSLAVCAGKTTALTSSPAASSWLSSDPAVATVVSGTVSGLSTGVADITVTATTGCKAVANVTVMSLPPTISGTLAACIGSTTSLSNTVPGGTWSSSAPGFATINSSGEVTGVMAGNTTISYNVGGCVRTGTFTVSALPTIVGGSTMCVGTSATLSSYTAGGTWSSGDVSQAIVGPTGIVTGVSAGTATISYSLGSGCTQTAVAVVNATPDPIGGASSLCGGTTTMLTNGVAGGSWSSSNTAYATVNASGNVTGYTAGVVTITYAMGSCRATQLVTVLPPPVPISGTASVCEGLTTLLTNPVSGTWSSLGATIATVSGTGLVSGVLAGNATIVFTRANGCQISRVVTVNVCASRQAITAVGATELNTQISMFPNPTNGLLTIQTPEAGTLSVFAVDGKEVASYHVAVGNTNLTLSKDLAVGVYMCRFNGDNGSNAVVRLIYQP